MFSQTKKHPPSSESQSHPQKVEVFSNQNHQKQQIQSSNFDTQNVFINVVGSHKWLRLQYKDQQQVQRMIHDYYVTKNFSKKIFDNLNCLGISTDILRMDTPENWIISELKLSQNTIENEFNVTQTQILQNEDMINNLLNGKTPEGNLYEKFQKGSYINFSGDFGSYTLDSIQSSASTYINRGEQIDLQIGGKPQTKAQIINIKGLNYKPKLQKGDIQCFVSHSVVRAFWLKLK